MKIEYGILSLFMALAYGIIVKFFPDFPVDANTLLALLVYVLLKFGVEIVGKPVFKAIATRFRAIANRFRK